MSRRQEDGFMLFVIATVWVLAFGASTTWELVVAGAVTLVCLGFIFRKR